MSEVKKTFDIKLDLKRSMSNDPFEVVEGDNGNVLRITLTDSGTPVSLSGCRVMAVFTTSDGTSMQDSEMVGGGVSISGDSNNEVCIDLFSASYSPDGVTDCELQIYSGESNGTLVTSSRFNFRSRRAIVNDGTIQSQEKYPVLVGLISTVERLEDDFETATAAANAAAQAATDAISSIWTGSQAEYDALSAHATGTLYFVLQEE